MPARMPRNEVLCVPTISSRSADDPTWGRRRADIWNSYSLTPRSRSKQATARLTVHGVEHAAAAADAAPPNQGADGAPVSI